MGNCLSPESNSEQVYIGLIGKIYQDIEKITNRQSFNKESNFYFTTLQPSLNRKGTVKKLIEHLKSHKTTIVRCSNYIIGKQFKDTTEQLAYYCLILMILEQFAKNIGILTQQQDIHKKKRLKFLKPLTKKIEKKQSLKKDPLVSVRSQSICLNFQRAVSSLFHEFIESKITREMSLSCMNSLKTFSQFDLFKFDKEMLNRHLRLLLQLSQNHIDSHTFCFLFLGNLKNFLLNGQEQADSDIHCQILNRTIEIRTRHKQLLENNEQILTTYKQIFSIYQTFLKSPQYRSLYGVTLEELNNNLTSPYALFQFQYNNILLYVLLNCLLVHSNAVAEQMNDLDNFNMSSVIDIKQYKNICSIQNRDIIFSTVIKYMQYGFNTNQDRFIVPFKKMCVCIIANIGITQIHIKTWIPIIQRLFSAINISILNFGKQLAKVMNETYNLSTTRFNLLLEVLLIILKSQKALQGQIPAISELLYGCNFRLNENHNINLKIAQIYRQIAVLKLSETLDQYGRQPYLPIFRFIHDFIVIDRFTNQNVQNLFGIIISFMKTCENLKTDDRTRLNYLLVILDKVFLIYNDPHLHSEFKFIYFEFLSGLFKIFKLQKIENSVKNYLTLHEQIIFIYSIDSIDNSKNIISKLKNFDYKPFKYSTQTLLKKIPSYHPSEFNKAKMSLAGQQSTQPEQDSFQYVQSRVRKTSVVFSCDVSYGNQTSFAGILESIKN